jgi:hypothetical protein
MGDVSKNENHIDIWIPSPSYVYKYNWNYRHFRKLNNELYVYTSLAYIYMY